MLRGLERRVKHLFLGACEAVILLRTTAGGAVRVALFTGLAVQIVVGSQY